jgi:hypothetical protein
MPENKPRAEALVAHAPEARIVELSSSLDEDVNEPSSSLPGIHGLFDVKSTVGLEGGRQSNKKKKIRKMKQIKF